MQLTMLGPPGPAPPAASAPGLALGHQLSTPGAPPAGPPGQGEIFAEAIAAAVAAAQSGAMQIGKASAPEEPHGASLLARLLLGSMSGETEPEGDATEAAGDTTQPDRIAGVGIAEGRAATAIVAVGTGADVGAVMSQRTAVTAPAATSTAAAAAVAATTIATTIVATTSEPVATAPVVADASAVIAPQAGTVAAVAVTTEAAPLAGAVPAAVPTSEGAPDGEPAAPMAETPVETPVLETPVETPVETPGDDDGPTEDGDSAEPVTYQAPGKSVTRGKAGDAPRSARAAMVSAVTGEPGRAAEVQGLHRGVGKRPAEAPAPAAAAVAAKGGEAQSPGAALAPLATQEAVATTGAASADGPQVAGRIAELVHSAVMRGASEVRLVLNPPELGRVDIRIVDTPGGLVVAMQAANGEARELISRALVSLQAALEGRELRVDRLTVDQPSQQSQDEPGWQGQRGEDGRQQGRDEGRDGKSNGNGFGARDGEAHEASSGTPPGRRVDAPAFGRRDGALDLVA